METGTLTRAFVVRDGAEAQVTFHNRYRTQDQTVTRTVYVTPECHTTVPKQTPRGGPTNPGTCTTPKARPDAPRLTWRTSLLPS